MRASPTPSGRWRRAIRPGLAGLAVLASALALGAAARPDGVFVWSERWEGFGGFSAIEVDPDGAGFVALSDRALLVTGRFTRVDGRITAITVIARAPILTPGGNAMSRSRGDSEGLALAPDGTLFISFEGVPRVRRQQGLDGRPSLLPGHPDFEAMIPNSALEALALAPDGSLYTIPEQARPEDGPFPVYRLADGAWSVTFLLPRRGDYLPVGADFGPDGLLYVLERDVVGLAFRSRVRRFAADGSGEATVLQTGGGELGNMEGISVWQDAGGLRMTLIADDNFSIFLSTEIAEFRLD